MILDNATQSYFPTFFVNDFWTFREHYYPINETLSSLPLTLHYNSLVMWKWQMMTQMEESFNMQKQWGTADEGDSDEIKRVLLETNVWLLALTGAVSVLHMVFDFLAFKNGTKNFFTF